MKLTNQTHRAHIKCGRALPGLGAALLSCSVFFAALPSTDAQGAPALTFTTDGFTDTTFAGTLGWEFTANSPVNVTALGFYNNKGPLSKSYTVALYDSSGNLLDSGSVGPTSRDTTVGAFDYTPLATPFTLKSGSSYIISAVISKGDVYYFDPGTITTDSSVTYVENRYDNAQTPSLTFPTTSDDADSGHGYFGPNFVVAPAPEPSALMALGLGLLGLGGLGLRKRFRTRESSVQEG